MALGKGDISFKPERDEIGPVPKFDDTVFVRRINVRERNEFAKPYIKASMGDLEEAAAEMFDARLRLVFAACVDASGEQLFENVEQVEQWPHAAVDFVAEEVIRLNGLTKEAADEIAGN